MHELTVGKLVTKNTRNRPLTSCDTFGSAPTVESTESERAGPSRGPAPRIAGWRPR
jgi:hypothetical protein